MLVLHDLDDTKMSVRISPKDARIHLALNLSKLSAYLVRDRAQAILDLVDSHTEAEGMLTRLLQETIYRDERAISLLCAAGLQVDDSFLTKKQEAKKVAMEESFKLTTMRRGPDRDVGIKLAIAVAGRCGLTLDHHGDVTDLAECLGSTSQFAKRILEAVGKKDTKSLFKRSKRKDSLVASDWPGVLRAFLDRPHFSRYVPGNDTVSLYYGHRCRV